MTRAEIEAAITETPARYAFVVEKMPALTKKNRTTKEATTFTVVKKSTFTAIVGANYEAEVNKTLAESGKPADFKAQKPSGRHHVEGNNYLLESDRQPNTFYLALTKFEDQKTTYYIDGRLATPEEVQDLKTNYLPKSGPSTGPVEWRTYGLESITSCVKA